VSASSDGGGRPPAPGQSPVLDYPLDYTFKVMGLAADDFPEHARRLVAAVVGDAPAERVIVRTSAQGKYHSVSVACLLTSEAQRRAVYQALHDDARVVYYL
jgi:putative lipoic acid-binding regulatory protein